MELESKNSDFLGILGTPRDTEYPWGEGANEQKTNKRMKRVCLVKSEIGDVILAVFRECFFRAKHSVIAKQI